MASPPLRRPLRRVVNNDAIELDELLYRRAVEVKRGTELKGSALILIR